MARTRTQYRCQACGRTEPKWLGMCPDCGEWNTLQQETPAPAGARAPKQAQPAAPRPTPADELLPDGLNHTPTGLSEFDRALGGGLVAGGSVLLGGEPGIGKSTLLLQVCCAVATKDRPALYVSGEESISQVRARADRLQLAIAGLHLLAETDCEAIAATIAAGSFALVVVDSVQTLHHPDNPSAPGTVSQVRDSAQRLADSARQSGTPLFLVGQVTKDGSLAGPRTLEHLVDTVLYFESDAGRSLRVVRAHKNRHGPAAEIGVFEMTAQGLQQVQDPAGVFLTDRPLDAPGSVVFPMLSGSRPILVEVQALVSPSVLAQPRRTALGCDPGRVALLAAVLERRAGVSIAGCDLFINIAGGLSLNEPAADLALICAILSSHLDRPLPANMAVFGEVGLSGEVRAVPMAPARLAQAVNLGYRRLLLPQGNCGPEPGCDDGHLLGLTNVTELSDILGNATRRS